MSDLLESDSVVNAVRDVSVLTVSFNNIGPQLVLSTHGALIGSSIAALEAQIDQIGCAESSDVVLDLTGLVEIDAPGLRVVIGMAQYVRALGRNIEITGATGMVARAIESAHL